MVDLKSSIHADSDKKKMPRSYRQAGVKVGLRKRLLLISDSIAEKGIKIKKIYSRVVDVTTTHIKRNGKSYAVASCMMFSLLAVGVNVINAATVYDYSYHGTRLGTVRDKADVETAVAQVADEYTDSDTYVELDPEVDITYEKHLDFDLSDEKDDADTAADKFSSEELLCCKGYAITVDGKVAANLESSEEAQSVLDEVREHYSTVDGEGQKLIKGVLASEVPEEEITASTVVIKSDLYGDALKEEALDTLLKNAKIIDDDKNASSSESSDSEDADNEDADSKDTDSKDADSEATVADQKESGDTSSAAADSKSSSKDADDSAKDADNNDSSNDSDAAKNSEDTDSEGISDEDAAYDIEALKSETNEAVSVLTEGKEIGGASNPLVYAETTSPSDLDFVQEVLIKPINTIIENISDKSDAEDQFIDEDGSSKILDVATQEVQVFTEDVPYETVYESSDKIYSGVTQLKSEGQNGTKRVVAYVHRVNGVEVSRTIVCEEVTSEPVNRVIQTGTRLPGASVTTGNVTATGIFMYPTTGTVTSVFGARWGSQHKGIDIGAAEGTEVYASDSGTVIYAGYNENGYGNLVKIDHGNGYVTYYGHNSQICVTVGQKVEKGDLIALVGSTGRSTGNHCHFEIRYNGTALDPAEVIESQESNK